jgi:hypothetical protein
MYRWVTPTELYLYAFTLPPVETGGYSQATPSGVRNQKPNRKNHHQRPTPQIPLHQIQNPKLRHPTHPGRCQKNPRLQQILLLTHRHRKQLLLRNRPDKHRRSPHIPGCQ